MSRLQWTLERNGETLTLTITHIDRAFIESYAMSANQLEPGKRSFYFDICRDMRTDIHNYSLYTGKALDSFNSFVHIGLLSWRNKYYDDLISSSRDFMRDECKFRHEKAAIQFEPILRKAMTEAEEYANAFPLLGPNNIGTEKEWREIRAKRKEEYREMCRVYGVSD